MKQGSNITSLKTDTYLNSLSALSLKAGEIDPELYIKHDVKRGLRDLNGEGVLTGLTRVSDVRAALKENGKRIPIHGRLFYRGYEVKDLVKGAIDSNRLGFEEVAYLLLFDKLPTEEELSRFMRLLADLRTLPTGFVRDVIMKAPSRDMMNTLARSVLTLYSYDEMADDVSPANVLRQSLQLISLFPLLSIYGYQAHRHYHHDKSLYIHLPKPELSTAENILRLLRSNRSYTPLEAKILDVALILHMDHGGGNNSTFTTHVVTSSYTDTYSVIAAAIGSLKGPRHGGANIKVVQMFDDMKSKITDWKDEDAVRDYLQKVLNKEAFDQTGLIYGIGHAIYSKSDPRAEIFKQYVEALSIEKGLDDEYALYCMVERLSIELINQTRHMFKGVSANVDFFSGFVYRMLNLPAQLFTPMFAIARIVGWSAHRLEELSCGGKIIRPAYMPISTDLAYVPMEERT